jgi:hypothetical protein
MATAYPIHHPLISRRVADAADRFEPVTDSVLGHRSLGRGRARQAQAGREVEPDELGLEPADGVSAVSSPAAGMNEPDDSSTLETPPTGRDEQQPLL